MALTGTLQAGFQLAFTSGEATSPSLPVTFATTYSLPTGGTTTNVNSGDNLQTAIDNASLGDVLVLEAGATFSGHFTLPNKTGTGWLYIISSALANLPEGTRVGPDDVAHMPTIAATGSTPIITSKSGSHHYRFAGINFSYSTDNAQEAINLGKRDDGQYATSLDDLSQYITIDRCYIHQTNDEYSLYIGVELSGRYLAVVDSYISNVQPDGDSKAIHTYNGDGPYRIHNNYLEASGENFMAGGDDPQITNLVPSDLEFTDNYCKKPLSWNPLDPSYDSIVRYIKNLFELKNAQRVLIDGNTFENCWLSAQTGEAILFTPRNQYGTAPWSTVQDVTFTNNRVINALAAINILCDDDIQQINEPVKRVTISNNFFYNCQNIQIKLASYDADHRKPGRYIVIANNLFFDDRAAAASAAGVAFSGYVQEPVVVELTCRDNIWMHGDYGIFGSVVGSGYVAVDTYVSSPAFAYNLFISRSVDRTYADDLTYFENHYPPATYQSWICDGISAAGFEDYANGDYRLATGSTYKGAGTGGSDPGPDWDNL